MILKSLNKLDPKFGYPDEVEYKNPSFHGHQKGMCIALKNLLTDEIEQNFLSLSLEGRDSLLEELLSKDNNILLIEERITQLDNENRLVPKMLYYLPYAVLFHSAFRPTVNDVTVDTNNVNQFEVEILFVKDGLNRYITVSFESTDSMFKSVHRLFEAIRTDAVNVCGKEYQFNKNHPLYKAGIRYKEKSEECEAGYYLDFYNEVGKDFLLGFTDLRDLRDIINSVRLLSLGVVL